MNAAFMERAILEAVAQRRQRLAVPCRAGTPTAARCSAAGRGGAARQDLACDARLIVDAGLARASAARRPALRRRREQGPQLVVSSRRDSALSADLLQEGFEISGKLEIPRAHPAEAPIVLRSRILIE
jgi:hypothetical protein